MQFAEAVLLLAACASSLQQVRRIRMASASTAELVKSHLCGPPAILEQAEEMWPVSPMSTRTKPLFTAVLP